MNMSISHNKMQVPSVRVLTKKQGTALHSRVREKQLKTLLLLAFSLLFASMLHTRRVDKKDKKRNTKRDQKAGEQNRKKEIRKEESFALLLIFRTQQEGHSPCK